LFASNEMNHLINVTEDGSEQDGNDVWANGRFMFWII